MHADDLLKQLDGQDPFRVSARVLTDSAAHIRLQQLEGRLERALFRPADDDATAIGPEQLATEISGLLDEHQPTEFVFEAVSATRWDELTREHAAGNDVGPSFWPAIMAECCVDPEGTDVGFFARLQTEKPPRGFSSGQWETILQAVREVNRGLTDLRPSFAATTLIRGTRRNSTTSAPEGSPDRGSSDE